MICPSGGIPHDDTQLSKRSLIHTSLFQGRKKLPPNLPHLPPAAGAAVTADRGRSFAESWRWHRPLNCRAGVNRAIQNPVACHRAWSLGGGRDWAERARQAGAGPYISGAKAGAAPNLVETAGTGRARHGAAASVGRHGGENARRCAAGGAADCF